VADAPDTIVLNRHRDLRGRRSQAWWRRGLLALVGIVPLLALLNLFGQRPGTTSTTVPAASLGVYAPTTVRGGLLWEARFHIKAHHEIKNAVLVLGSGWLEGMTLNTLEPSPVGEASNNGKLELTLGHIPADQSYLLFIQFQTNPTNVGHRSRPVWLYDGKTLLAKVNQKVTVFP
jgi:hypothetical protein